VRNSSSVAAPVNSANIYDMHAGNVSSTGVPSMCKGLPFYVSLMAVGGNVGLMAAQRYKMLTQAVMRIE
jgi:hypothetical protein